MAGQEMTEDEFKMSMQGHGRSELFMLWLADTMRRELENGRPENALAAMREHYVGIHIDMVAVDTYILGMLG